MEFNNLDIEQVEILKNKIVIKLKPNAKIWCSYHKSVQPISSFSINPRTQRFYACCESCRNNIKQWYHTHQDQRKEYFKDYSRGSNLDSIIVAKINKCKSNDRAKHRPIDNKYIDVDYIKNLIQQNGPICKYCQCELKYTNFDANEKSQFTINRLDNNLPHLKGNCEICCWKCNNSRK